MRPLDPWQEVVGHVRNVDQTEEKCRVEIDGYTINISSDSTLSEDDRIAVLRTESSYLVLHDD